MLLGWPPQRVCVRDMQGAGWVPDVSAALLGGTSHPGLERQDLGAGMNAHYAPLL